MMDDRNGAQRISNRPLRRARRLAIATLAILALLVPAMAQALAGDTADGRGIDASNNRFSFSAEGTGLLDRANGTWKHTITSSDPNRRLGGIVTCMLIVGKAASIGGRITQDSFGVLENQGFVIFVEDEAKPGDLADDYFFQLSATPPSTCPTPFTFEFNILNGDIAIVPGT
jgi:hypothetical protein